MASITSEAAADDQNPGGALLKLVGAEVRVGDALLLADIDLTVCPGQLIGLIGVSGSGKTTLLHLLDGERTTSSGHRELVSGPVALLPQDAPAALNPALTIARQLKLLDRRCVGVEAVTRLAEVGLDDPDRVLGSRPGQLSGGECQRVVWAMMLIAAPRVLLLDEPTSALDEARRLGSMELLLRYLRAVDGAAVVASHDPGLLLEYCTELTVLDQGRIVASGTLEELLRGAEAHPLVRALAGAAASHRGGDR